MSDYYNICSRCVMDTSDSQIVFDQLGQCNHCTAALARIKQQILSPTLREAGLNELVKKIKQNGEGKEYDCVIGVSGGVDSTTVAFVAKQHGLRPLAVHFDNGWNSELAVDNIVKTLHTLDIELYTYVVDWEEFRDLQMAYLKSGVVNCEAPTDHAITALLFKVAKQNNLKYILSGSNIVTEAIMPYSWSYYAQDLRNLEAIHRQFGTMPLSTFPKISIMDFIRYVFFYGIRQIPVLNYITYDKEQWKKFLEENVGWRDYGGKHYESVWTRFYQGYFLPRKFGVDKRRAHLSTLICSGQITRDDALELLKNPPYLDGKLLVEDLEYVSKKFGLTIESFESLINAPQHAHNDYPSNYFLFHKLKKLKNAFRKIATES